MVTFFVSLLCIHVRCFFRYRNSIFYVLSIITSICFDGLILIFIEIILWSYIVIKVFLELIILLGLWIICSFMLPTMSRLMSDSICGFSSITHIKAIYVNGIIARCVTTVITGVFIVVVRNVGFVFKLEIFCDTIAEFFYSLFLFYLREVIPFILFKCTQVLMSFATDV